MQLDRFVTDFSNKHYPKIRSCKTFQEDTIYIYVSSRGTSLKSFVIIENSVGYFYLFYFLDFNFHIFSASDESKTQESHTKYLRHTIGEKNYWDKVKKSS